MRSDSKDPFKDPLDEILDRAIAGYSDAEPLAGLEQRVLNRVGSVRTMPRSGRVKPAVFSAIALAALVLVFVMIRAEQKPQRVAAPAASLRVSSPAPRLEPLEAPIQPVRTARQHSSVPRQLPRLAQFPTPSPLTAEERALVALAERHGEETRKALDELEKKNEEAIVITPIQITPLGGE